MVELTAHPMRRELDRLLAADCDRDAVWDQLRLANLVYGRCTVKAMVSGDGESKAAFQLEGRGREVLLALGTDTQGKLVEVKFTPEALDWLAQGYH
jgi:hypothetical protein